MNLKSLEQVLQGVGKLRAASVVAWMVNAAAMLSLNIPSSVQSAGIVGATVLLAAVHGADGYIRGRHVAALPALIEQGAESVAKVQDPRVDAVATSVETIAARMDALEKRPAAPSLPEIIAGLTGQVPVAVTLPTPTPEVPATPPQA